ncbi:uncharacterized protein LOC122806958 [Protopterus annectens]|uniref:uncharacterized protein LOC122806958 n=1 Tax=Protopterus annectens TaxID=7888 RepID=UPI001CFA5661|nr:uncharacterized protein LOC122806958 [Protopterus annectens]
MHRAYQPHTPATNKYLKKKWDVTHYEMHRRKVATATAAVDTKGLPTPAHLHVNLKKLQLEEERLAKIERDNQILSSKLAYIVRSKGLVDHRNDYTGRSLNSEKRLREFQKISRDNQAILQRITNKESEYRREKWEKEWDITNKRLEKITSYPRTVKKSKQKVHIQEEEEETSHNTAYNRKREKQLLPSVASTRESSKNDNCSASSRGSERTIQTCISQQSDFSLLSLCGKSERSNQYYIPLSKAHKQRTWSNTSSSRGLKRSGKSRAKERNESSVALSVKSEDINHSGDELRESLSSRCKQNNQFKMSSAICGTSDWSKKVSKVWSISGDQIRVVVPLEVHRNKESMQASSIQSESSEISRVPSPTESVSSQDSRMSLPTQTMKNALSL